MIDLDPIQYLALTIFLLAVAVIIWGKIDRTAIAIIGVLLMVATGVFSEIEAFNYVDWNVIAILIGIWIIAGYFNHTGIPQFLAIKILHLSQGNIAIFISLIGLVSGFVSMFLDNVVVILMFAPLIFHITRKMGLNPFPFIIFVGLSANFMGTALLLGDLPPQMLHSVAGAEFLEFIWSQGKPSSFPILTITFLITVWAFYSFRFKRTFSQTNAELKALTEEASSHIKDKNFAIIVIAAFIAVVLGMSFRPIFGVKLGFIALSGAVVLVLFLEILRGKVKCPSFEEVLTLLDWRAIFFYIALFALVGGIKHVGILEMLAKGIAPYFHYPLLGISLLYWVTTPIVGVIEHDAYILTFLYTIKDLGQLGINPWPLWWALLWAGTLGSNLTVAGAPALYVAMNLAEREMGRKVSLREFFSYTVPFVIISALVCFILLLLIWV